MRPNNPVRDPVADHLITAQNAAFLLIDYQPAQPILSGCLAFSVQ
jgi:hypothetical protein